MSEECSCCQEPSQEILIAMTVNFTVYVDGALAAGVHIIPHTQLDPITPLGTGWTTTANGTIKTATNGFQSGEYAFELQGYCGRILWIVKPPAPPTPPATPVPVTLNAFTQVSITTTVGGNPTQESVNVRYSQSPYPIVEPGLPYDTGITGTYTGLHIVADTHYFEIVGVDPLPGTSVQVTTKDQNIPLGN
jgi:hypothetical protein